MPNIPAQAIEFGFEDIQGIESNINTLFQTYIQPIDNIRSISRPSTSPASSSSSSGSTSSIIQNNFTNIQIQSFTLLESRAHAFYRMLGLPVVVADGRFYNAGFPSTFGKPDTKLSINSTFFSDPLQTLINTRETLSPNLISIFANQDITSSVYAIVLRYIKPFQNIKIGGGPLDVDPQTFKVDVRNQIILNFANYGVDPSISASVTGTSSEFTLTPIGGDFSGGQHILKPFITDPRIVGSVMPDLNMIAVPFMPDKNSLLIENGVYALRPGIELIIRQRLQNNTKDLSFFQNLSTIQAGTTLPGVDVSSLELNTIAALSTNNSIASSDVINILNNFSSLQVITVSNLIKQIKSCMVQLNKAMSDIDLAKSRINWVPIPSIKGPETGANGYNASHQGLGGNSEIDARVLALQIQQLNASSSTADNGDIGAFASPFTGRDNTQNVKSYSDQLKALVQQRDRIANKAAIAMGVIEILTGEVSGLGLIDVLAIYTALWAIDISNLIAFLDDDSFTRLTTNNPDISSAAQAAKGTSILTALGELEHKVINILAFADSLIVQQLQSPLQAAGGSI